MRRLILKMSISLDGFVAGPNGESDWLLRGRSEDGRRWTTDTLSQAGLHVMGRKTFAVMAGHWPGADNPMAAPMNAIPKAVFTRQAGLNLGGYAGNWASAEVMAGDLAAGIARLKQQPGGDILAHGGAGFGQSLAASGLVDEYRLVVHPVALGKGIALFAGLRAPLNLELRATTLFQSGVAAQVYWPV